MRQMRTVLVLALGGAGGAAAVIIVILIFGYLNDLTDDTVEHSEAYLDAETTLLIALSDVFGSEARLGNPYVSSEVEHVYIYQRLFHFESADPGGYVQETGEFYSWLRDFMEHRVARAAGRTEDVRPEIDRRISHAQSQIEAAIYEPDSEIGKAFREMEEQQREETGSGSDVYWEWLIEPYIHGVYFYSPNPPIGGSIGGLEEVLIGNLQRDYEAARWRGEINDDLLFADFLAANEYLPESMSR
jgi:hypothetical protein